MRIGIVDLDTSHPQNWIPLERQLGHEVVGVWDGGSVHRPDYVEAFAKEHNIARAYDCLAEMVPDVDCAVVHSCDWDKHVARARPFVEAGKAVLIDKPIAGNVADLNQFKDWVRQGARITGGSSLRFCREIQEWRARPSDERGTPHTILTGCGVDDFNYGIHAYSLLSGIMGPGIVSVRHLGEKVQRRIQVNWADGRVGFVVAGEAESGLPFHATIATERQVTQIQVDAGRLYLALLEAVLPYLAGETETPPVAFDELIEPELCALAARRSWRNKDSEVALTDLGNDGYDGALFAVGYRKARYPG